jgi:hypothetical protein
MDKMKPYPDTDIFVTIKEPQPEEPTEDQHM